MRSTSSNQAKSVNPNIGGERAVIAKVCLILKSTLEARGLQHSGKGSRA